MQGCLSDVLETAPALWGFVSPYASRVFGCCVEVGLVQLSACGQLQAPPWILAGALNWLAPSLDALYNRHDEWADIMCQLVRLAGATCAAHAAWCATRPRGLAAPP